jgi:hypothetical protein
MLLTRLATAVDDLNFTIDIVTIQFLEFFPEWGALVALG